MPAGKRDRRIRIEQAERGEPTPSGDRPLTWSLLAEVWSAKEPYKGKEIASAQNTVAKVDTRFRVLWTKAIAQVTANETFRIVFEGRSYDIIEAFEIERHVEIEFLAWARAD